MPEQSNDYRIIVFGSGSVGKFASGAPPHHAPAPRRRTNDGAPPTSTQTTCRRPTEWPINLIKPLAATRVRPHFRCLGRAGKSSLVLRFVKGKSSPRSARRPIRWEWFAGRIVVGERGRGRGRGRDNKQA